MPDGTPEPLASAADSLSELEATVLGVIWLMGACTPYAVRTGFRESESSQWSGSAGAIYPLMKRLEARGLLRSEPDATGRRPRRLYELTPRGRERFQRWLAPPVGEDSIGLPADPVRTRVRLLGALPPADRLRFVEQAEAALDRQLSRLEHLHAEAASGRSWGRRDGEPDPFWTLAVEGGLAVARARRDWLASIRRRLPHGD